MIHSSVTPEGLERRRPRFKSSFAVVTSKTTLVTLAVFVAALSLSACSSGGGSALGGSSSASLTSLCVSKGLSGNGNPDESPGQRNSTCQCEVNYMLNHGVSASQVSADFNASSTNGEVAYGQAVEACVLGSGSTGTTMPTTPATTTVPSTTPTSTPTSSPTTVPATTTPTSPTTIPTTTTP
jgi:hypothetical protein